MTEYLGLLISITEGLSIPKKKVFLSIRYSKYKITFPVVSGGDTTVFNQGYFFRNYRAGGHDEMDLPVLIQLFEKRMTKTVEIAKLRVEASNFCNYDYYEPLSFCLSPIDQYSSYKFQLKIMFQLVKSSSSLHTDRMINPKVIKPIALRIDLNSARLHDSMLDKTYFYSCTLNVNKDETIRTNDIKGLCPQWDYLQIISPYDFENKSTIVLTVHSVKHPHLQSTKQFVGEARLSLKQIFENKPYNNEIPIIGKKRKEMGKLIVNILPIFSHSRDRAVPPERISQLQPNVLPDTVSMISVPLTQKTSGYVAAPPGTASFSPGPLSQENSSPRGLDGLSLGMESSRQSSVRMEAFPSSPGGVPSSIATPQLRAASPKYGLSMPSSGYNTIQSGQDIQRVGVPSSVQGILNPGDLIMEEVNTPGMEQDSNNRRESVISRIQSTRTGILYHSYNVSELEEQQPAQPSEKQNEASSHQSLEQPIQVYLRQPVEEYVRDDISSVRSNCSTLTGTEIKRLQDIPRYLSGSPVPGMEREVNDVYISKCTAIVRRDTANLRTMSLRVLPRFHNAYVEKVRFV